MYLGPRCLNLIFPFSKFNDFSPSMCATTLLDPHQHILRDCYHHSFGQIDPTMSVNKLILITGSRLKSSPHYSSLLTLLSDVLKLFGIPEEQLMNIGNSMHNWHD